MCKFFLYVKPFLANYLSTWKAVFFLVVARKLLEAHVVKRLDQKYVTALAKYVYLPLLWHNVNTKFSVIGKILD